MKDSAYLIYCIHYIAHWKQSLWHNARERSEYIKNW